MPKDIQSEYLEKEKKLKEGISICVEKIPTNNIKSCNVMITECDQGFGQAVSSFYEHKHFIHTIYKHSLACSQTNNSKKASRPENVIGHYRAYEEKRTKVEQMEDYNNSVQNACGNVLKSSWFFFKFFKSISNKDPHSYQYLTSALVPFYAQHTITTKIFDFSLENLIITIENNILEIKKQHAKNCTNIRYHENKCQLYELKNVYVSIVMFYNHNSKHMQNQKISFEQYAKIANKNQYCFEYENIHSTKLDIEIFAYNKYKLEEDFSVDKQTIINNISVEKIIKLQTKTPVELPPFINSTISINGYY